MGRLLVLAASASLALAMLGPCGAQTAPHSTAIAALADTFATETGGFVLDIPGIAGDFVTFSDGALDVRPDGTARLTVFLQRRTAIDREFMAVLELAGPVTPSDPSYPPAGSPVLTLQPSAYAPAGPVDPTTYVYWTQVTGTLTGLRAFAGAQITATNLGAAQLGLGASNKNVRNGLAVDLALTVVQPPAVGPLSIGGPALLRAELVPSHACCLAHVDSQPAASGGNARLAVDLPG
ncbi:MAG TPA: hypothetical protein VFL14_03885, partial [Xanthomonadales bacterium]|nr:hypothetical protein [Xanthomonadales bacterium]